MEVTLTLNELRNIFVEAKTVGRIGVFGHDQNMKFHALARRAKRSIEETPVGNETMDDLLDESGKLQKAIEKHRNAALIEAGEDFNKFNFLFSQKIAADPYVQQAQEQEVAAWKTKIKFEFIPIEIDVEKVQNLHKLINKGVEGYKFDFSLILNGAEDVEFRGKNYSKRAYPAFQNLILEGFVRLSTDEDEEKEETPAKKLKNLINKPK